MISRHVVAASIGLLCLLLGACSTPPRADVGPTAECPVCRENADLACLNVHIRGTTPRAQYKGETYYFCSDECRDRFLKDPGRYAGK